MKKNFILLLFFGLCISLNAQQVSKHNKHWLFGYKVHFDFGVNYTDPINQSDATLRVSPNTLWGLDNTVLFGSYSYATVSDNNGNFLFCSDGSRLFKKGATNLVPFKAYNSDNGKSIILPKPNFANTYCVITNSDVGLDYFQVTANSSTNVFEDTSFPRTNLLDHLGNPITYNTKSTKITSARHSNGKDYWLIVQVRKDSETSSYTDYVYSYLMTCNGIINSIGESKKPYYYKSLPKRERHGEMGDYRGINLKISHANIENNSLIPETIKLALTYSRDVLTSGQNIEGALTGEFNRTNGMISFTNTINLLSTDPNFNTTSLEFSPNSNLLYITGTSSIYQLDLNTNTMYSLPAISTSNLTTELYDPSADAYGANIPLNISDIQISPNNKIYVTVPGRKHIAEITNPNSYGTAQYTNSSSLVLLPNVTHTNGTLNVNYLNGYTQYYFPQLVQKQAATTTSNIIANNDSYSYINRCVQGEFNVLENDLLNGSPFSLPLSFYSVNQVGTVSPSSGIGNITLQNNGVLFIAPGIAPGTYTLSYTICSSSPCGNCSNTATITIVVTQLGVVDVKSGKTSENKTSENVEIKVFPNPSKDYFYVENLNTNQITIYDSYGKFIKNIKVENKSAIIDLSEKPSGIYYLVFESENKRVERKLIKN